MTDCLLRCLLRCLYSASSSCNNQSETSVAAHDIWQFRTKLHYLQKRSHWYQPREFPSITDRCYVIIARCYIGYNSPSASDVSGLIYVDRMIKTIKCRLSLSCIYEHAISLWNFTAQFQGRVRYFLAISAAWCTVVMHGMGKACR